MSLDLPHGPTSRWTAIIGVLLSWGTPGLFLLAALDSIGLPIVGGVDALLIAIAISNAAHAYLAAICAIAGSILGSVILFAIARKGGEVLLQRHIRGRRGARLHEWFEEYGLLTIFIPAFCPIPLPMKIPVFCAGALEVRLSYFLAVLLAARTIRYFGLAYLALNYGSQTYAFLRSHLVAVLGTAAVLGLLAVAVIHFMRRQSDSRADPAAIED